MLPRNVFKSHPSALLIAGILLIAACLRAPVTGVAPLLDAIRHGFGLGTAAAGAITTLPLLAFAVASPFCVILARRQGLERSLFLALALVMIGIAVRSAGALWMLYFGTAVIGLGIAIANVLLPSLLKRDFPNSIATLTSAYALTAGGAAALASALAVPLADLSGSSWNRALATFVIFPLVAMVLWLPQLGVRTSPVGGTLNASSAGPIWRSALAWQVTAFFGLNSLVYYVTVTWLPAILVGAGLSPTAAGAAHGVSQLATAVPGLFFGTVVKRLRDQRAVAAATALITATSLIGLLVHPAWGFVWAALFGFGTGATFILGLAFISLRALTVAQSAALSGMSQTIGYAVAATAPPLIGALHDRTASWSAGLVICAILSLVMAVVGLKAGRARHI